MIPEKKSRTPALVIMLGGEHPGAMEQEQGSDSDMPDFEPDMAESSGAFGEEDVEGYEGMEEMGDDSAAEAAEPACLEKIKGMLVKEGVSEETAPTLAHDIYTIVAEELAKTEG